MIAQINSSQASITLEDGMLCIREWQINHPAVLGYLTQAEAADLTRDLENLLVIGATVMNTARPTLDLGHVKREFDGFRGQLEQSYQDFFGEAGQVGRLLSGTNQAIANCLKQYLDDSSASFVGVVVQKQVEELLRQQAQNWQEQLRILFDASQPTSPANSVVRAVQEQLTSVQTGYQEIRDLFNQQAGRDAESKRGTYKGRKYEQAACEVVREIAGMNLDTFQATGDYTGLLPDCKKGDAVITLNPNFAKGSEVKIVFEMKDKRIESGEVIAELTQAMQNREAHIAVAVLAGTDIRASGGLPLGQWNDKHYFCVLDRNSYDPMALQLVYAQARLAALKASSYSDEVSFALKDISLELESAISAFNTRTAIKTCLDNGLASIKEAQHQFDNLTDNALQKLQRIQKLLKVVESE
jgi:hypothetical protein